MARDAVKFMRTGTRGSPSWPGQCPQAGYVDADCSDRVVEIACRQGGPYVFKAGLRLDILFRMERARLQARQAEPVEPFADGMHMHIDRKPARHLGLDVRASPAHHVMVCRIRTR